MEDVCFLIGLSQRGVIVVLDGGHRESIQPVDHYILQYCRDGARNTSHKIPIGT